MRCGALLVGVTLITSCTQTEVERERLKEELKQEILAELAAEQSHSAPPGLQQRLQEPPRSAREAASPRGNVTGKVLLGNRGLAGCRVRLIRLERYRGGLGLFSGSDYSGAEVYQTVTGDNGFYTFEEIPVGVYRLKWLPKGETGWIRALSGKPDVIVEGERTSIAGDFHAGRPVVANETR